MDETKKYIGSTINAKLRAKIQAASSAMLVIGTLLVYYIFGYLHMFHFDKQQYQFLAIAVCGMFLMEMAVVFFIAVGIRRQ